MLSWVAKVFRSWFEAVLWLVLIIFTIGGGIIGSMLGRYSRDGSGGYIFVGVVLGVIIGHIVVVIGGGFIANFLNLVDNVAVLKNKLCGKEILDSTLKEQEEVNGEILPEEKFVVKQVVALRIRPGNENPSIATLEEYEIVNRTQEIVHGEDKWAKIKTNKGLEGWCFLDCLRKEK
ncbi:hypothetical protein FACS1894164_17970 [Spirochaetia bacterium]|nr:hypothetical protein FACS1894164_17970 [Spirochaetia bacterium]